MSDGYEVLTLRYGERNGRVRGDSFLFDDAHDTPHATDYSVRLIRGGRRAVPRASHVGGHLFYAR